MTSEVIAVSVCVCVCTHAHRAHEGVKDGDGEGSTTSERLRHVQLSVRIVIVILIQKLHVRVVAWRWNTTYGDVILFGRRKVRVLYIPSSVIIGISTPDCTPPRANVSNCLPSKKITHTTFSLKLV